MVGGSGVRVADELRTSGGSRSMIAPGIAVVKLPKGEKSAKTGEKR